MGLAAVLVLLAGAAAEDAAAPRRVLAGAGARTRTVTVGPRMAQRHLTADLCVTAHESCLWTNLSLPRSRRARIPVSGTVTTWRVQGFDGTASLLILARHGARFAVIGRSAAEFRPCGIASSGACRPGLRRVAAFHTQLSVRAGEYLGLELTSPFHCTPTSTDQNCAAIGLEGGPGSRRLKGAVHAYFDPVPVEQRPAGPRHRAPGAIMVNADVRPGG